VGAITKLVYKGTDTASSSSSATAGSASGSASASAADVFTAMAKTLNDALSATGAKREMTVNVEYNQLDPLLRDTVSPEGDVNDPITGTRTNAHMLVRTDLQTERQT
jgi:hypothetical protein